MIRPAFAAAALFAAPLLAVAPAAAQSTTQEQIDTRYDRALAAGYKALFLCSAIANAERNGAQRSPESVMAWELTGIQAPLDQLIDAMPYELSRDKDGELRSVSVTWAEDARPRIAVHNSRRGCAQLPIDGAPMPFATKRAAQAAEQADVVVAEGPLASATARAFASDYGDGTRTTAVIAMRDGRIVGERYAEGFGPAVPQRTWSVAKSIAATLVGAAVQRGETEVEARAGLGLSPTDRRSAISMDDLLRMASGRYSDTPGNRTDPLYFGGSTVEETALHWPLVHEPGSVYRYANNDTLAAVKAIGKSIQAHPPEEFFARLGMNDTVAETDWRGDYILSSQVWSTARDLARFGQLYLDDGVLPSGERVLPEGWVDYVSSPAGPQPDSPLGYGAGFWLLNASDGVPADTFAALGNRGQIVVVVPSRNVVLVRRGEDPAGTRFDVASFARDMLRALDD